MTIKASRLGTHITPASVFHGYVLGFFIGIRWKISTSGAIGNKELTDIVKRYLTFTCGKDEWIKYQILDVIRDKNQNAIRDEARLIFPSLFPKGRQRPLQVPDELEGQNIKFDIEFINELKQEVLNVKKDNDMNVNDTTDKSEAKSTTVVVPASVSVQDLNLENFRELTGKRFRMTKDQREREKAGKLTRVQALEEFKAMLLGNSSEVTNNE